MGLDFVECVMSLEEELGLRLTDEEVSSWRTVGDVFAHLERRRPERTGCATQVAFHFVRRELMAHGYPRHGLTTNFDLSTLSASTWRALEFGSTLRWPSRSFGPATRLGVLAGAVASTAVAAQAGWAPATATLLASQWLATWSSREFGRLYVTLGEFVSEAGRRWAFPLGFFTRTKLWSTVCHVVSDQSGWPIERIGESTQLSDLFPDG